MIESPIAIFVELFFYTYEHITYVQQRLYVMSEKIKGSELQNMGKYAAFSIVALIDSLLSRKVFDLSETIWLSYKIFEMFLECFFNAFLFRSIFLKFLDTSSTFYVIIFGLT